MDHRRATIRGGAIYTIGTAGHIDHGKSTLCQRLTGIDTDRLAEEKARGISIELGFARFETPAGKAVGIVDVPGHEKFIRNMVAGVSGIQAFLFTIAADEGIMPQTREHLDILSVLGVHHGIFVLTKCDLVDEEWLELVEQELREYLAATPFSGLSILRSSIKDSMFPTRLGEALDEVLGDLDEVRPAGLFRMPIDRVFTIKGRGTIVTGTVFSGQLDVGETVEFLPERLQSRVRGIQSFNHDDPRALEGQRAALNVPDVDPSELSRGSVCCRPNTYDTTTRADCRIQLLESLPPFVEPLENGTRVRVHAGTTEVMARLFLIGVDAARAGSVNFIQMHLESPVALVRGERILVRTFSPLFTIGGGVVIDPSPSRHKRDLAAVENLNRIVDKNSQELIMDFLKRDPYILLSPERISRDLGLPLASVIDSLQGLGDDIGWLSRKRKLVYSLSRSHEDGMRLAGIVESFHNERPLEPGIERASLLAAFCPSMEPDLFNEFLTLVADDVKLDLEGALVKKVDHRPRIDPNTERQMALLIQVLEEQSFLGANQFQAASGLKAAEFEAALRVMLNNGTVVKLPDGQLVLGKVVKSMEERLVAYLSEVGLASTGSIKGQLGLTRKGLIPLLEFFDEKGLTQRSGNERRLRKTTRS